MMWLCNSCAVARIKAGTLKPLNYYWPPNEAPWKEGSCDDCGKTEHVSNWPVPKSNKP